MLVFLLTLSTTPVLSSSPSLSSLLVLLVLLPDSGPGSPSRVAAIAGPARGEERMGRGDKNVVCRLKFGGRSAKCGVARTFGGVGPSAGSEERGDAEGPFTGNGDAIGIF